MNFWLCRERISKSVPKFAPGVTFSLFQSKATSGADSCIYREKTYLRAGELSNQKKLKNRKEVSKRNYNFMPSKEFQAISKRKYKGSKKPLLVTWKMPVWLFFKYRKFFWMLCQNICVDVFHISEWCLPCMSSVKHSSWEDKYSLHSGYANTRNWTQIQDKSVSSSSECCAIEGEFKGKRTPWEKNRCVLMIKTNIYGMQYYKNVTAIPPKQIRFSSSFLYKNICLHYVEVHLPPRNRFTLFTM